MFEVNVKNVTEEEGREGEGGRDQLWFGVLIYKGKKVLKKCPPNKQKNPPQQKTNK